MDNKNPTDELKKQALEENADRGPQPPTGPKSIYEKPDKTFGAKRLTPDEVKRLMPYYVDIGERPPFLRLFKRLAWDRRLFRERRKLRKQLKSDFGMKLNRREFEDLATEVGLGLQKSPLLFFWWFWRWLFGGGGIFWLLGIATLLLSLFYAYSAITELAGSFTIQLNYNTMQSGFVLSETPDFDVKTGRLIGEALEKVNAMTLGDIPKDIDDHDGSNNGKRYVAYSFYIRNDGDEPEGYEYVLHLSDSYKGAEQAIWVMLFEDGKQAIYAMPSADGDPERHYGYIRNAPFYDVAYNPEYQYYQKDDGKWGVQVTNFVDDEIVVQGIVRDVPPGGVHRYTVVIWCEGYDPECTDAIFDGYAKYYMEFNPIDEKKVTLFSNLYHTEFDEPIGKIGKDEDDDAN